MTSYKTHVSIPLSLAVLLLVQFSHEECPCASYFGMDWECLQVLNFTSYNFSANNCTKSVFKWMDSRIRIWDRKLLPSNSWFSVSQVKSSVNCSSQSLIGFSEYKYLEDPSYGSHFLSGVSIQRTPLIWNNLTEDECLSNYSGLQRHYKIIFGRQFFSYLTWTSNKQFFCYLYVTGANENDALWNSHIGVRSWTNDGKTFNKYRVLPGIRIKLDYDNGGSRIEEALLKTFGKLSEDAKSLLSSAAFGYPEYDQNSSAGIANVYFSNNSLQYGAELACSGEADVYETEELDAEDFNFKSYPHDSKFSTRSSLQNPPQNLSLVSKRIFRDSTFFFTLGWTNPIHWDSYPRHYVIKCATLDSQYPNYPPSCLDCLKNEWNNSKKACWKECWEQVMQAEPAAVIMHQTRWSNNLKSFVFRTNLGQSIQYDKNYEEHLGSVNHNMMVPVGHAVKFHNVVRYGWHLAGHYDSKSDAMKAPRSQLTYLSEAVILPGDTYEPVQLESQEVQELVTMCRVQAHEGSGETESNTGWSDPIVINHVGYHFAPRFSVVALESDSKLIVAQIDYLPQEGIFLASFVEKLSSRAVIPAIDYNEDGQFIDEQEMKKWADTNETQTGKRTACYHPVINIWYAFVEQEAGYMLSCYAGTTGTLIWEAISWKSQGVTTKNRPIQLRCSQVHAFLIWSVVTDDDNIQIEMIRLKDDGTVSKDDAVTAYTEEKLCACSKGNKISSMSYGLFLENIQEPMSPEVSVLCGNTLCSIPVFADEAERSKELVTFDWLPKYAAVSWLSMDANDMAYITHNESSFLFICSLKTGAVELTMKRFYGPLEEVEYQDNYPGFKSHATDEYSLENTKKLGTIDQSLRIIWQSAFRDATTFPVPPYHCMFPEVATDIKISMISNLSVSITVSRIFNNSVECEIFAKPPVVFRVQYDVVTDNEFSNCNSSCNNLISQRARDKSLIELIADSNDEILCALECYRCATASCVSVESKPTWDRSVELQFSGFDTNTMYLIKLTMSPDISQQAGSLWYSGKALKPRYLLYKGTYEEPITKGYVWTIALGVSIPLLIAIILLVSIMIFFYKRRWYLYRSLPRISLSDIKREKKIGHGHFGDVWLATLLQRNEMIKKIKHVRQKTVVVKVLKESASDKERKDFRDEALLLSKFHCNYIIQPLGICMESKPMMIVMEYMSGGSLISYLNEKGVRENLEVEGLFNIVEDILKACVYLESEGYIHRDIAARNCLVSLTNGNLLQTKNVKLADFGRAKDVKSSAIYTSESTGDRILPVAWTAPESFDGRFSSRSDVFAFGVLMFEVFSWVSQPFGYCSAKHECPLKCMTLAEIEFSVCVKQKTLLDYAEPCTATFTSALRDLIQLCFLRDSFSRPSFKRLLNFLHGARREILEAEVPEIVRNPSEFESGSPINDMQAGIVYPKKQTEVFAKHGKLMKSAYGDDDTMSNGSTEGQPVYPYNSKPVFHKHGRLMNPVYRDNDELREGSIDTAVTVL